MAEPVSDKDVAKILKRFKDSSGKTSHNALKRYWDTLPDAGPRPRGSGGKDAVKKLARLIAEKERALTPSSFSRATAAQKRFLKMQRAEKLAKVTKPLGAAAKWGGKVIGKLALPVEAVVQTVEGVRQFDPKIREKSLEQFKDYGAAGLPWNVGKSAPLKHTATAAKGILSPVRAVSAYLQTYAGKGESPATQEIDKIVGRLGEPVRSAAQIKADTDGDGKISDEERAAALKDRVPMLGDESVTAMRKGRRAAVGEKYLADVPADLRPVGRDKWFYGGAGDTEFEDAEMAALVGRVESKTKRPITSKWRETLQEQHKGTVAARKAEEERGEKLPSYTTDAKGKSVYRGESYKPATEEYFSPDDRAAFRKAALDGTLVEMFDTDNSGSLSSKERALYFDKTRGFKAGGPIAVREAAAAEAAEPFRMKGIIPPPEEEKIAPPLIPEEWPDNIVSPLTGKSLAGEMRASFEELQDDPAALRDSMTEFRQRAIDAGIADEDKFNRVGRKMYSGFKKQKAAEHIEYLRSPEGSEWVDTPGLDKLAALQDAPFGTGTALRGSVGGLKDASRQLESEKGRLNRHARQLARDGHHAEAGKVRARAGAVPSRGGITTQRDRLEEGEKKKADARQRLRDEAKRRREEEERRREEEEGQITAEGERKIKENTT